MRLLIVAPAFGGRGAPSGVFWMIGNGMSCALFKVESKVPMLIGPSMMTPFLSKVTLAFGCVQSEPWNCWAFQVTWMAVVFWASDTRLSIELLPLEPCHAPAAVLQGDSAQRLWLLPLKVIVPVVSMTATPMYVAV